MDAAKDAQDTSMQIALLALNEWRWRTPLTGIMVFINLLLAALVTMLAIEGQ